MSSLKWDVNHPFHVPELNHKFKIFSEITEQLTMGGVNHLSMSRLNLKFKIFSELLVSNNEGRVNHLSIVQAKT